MNCPLMLTIALLTACLQSGADRYAGWSHAGAITILTTPEGAGLAAGVSVQEFPLLVRLQSDAFDFTQAAPQGNDVRFTDSSGALLSYQVEQWDAAQGTASLWVRVRRIEGDARQTIQMHWGKADAKSESNAKGGVVS